MRHLTTILARRGSHGVDIYSKSHVRLIRIFTKSCGIKSPLPLLLRTPPGFAQKAAAIANHLELASTLLQTVASYKRFSKAPGVKYSYFLLKYGRSGNSSLFVHDTAVDPAVFTRRSEGILERLCAATPEGSKRSCMGKLPLLLLGDAIDRIGSCVLVGCCLADRTWDRD